MITQIKHNILSLTVCCLAIFLTGCHNNVVFSKYTTLPQDGWRTENKLSFDVEIKDNAPSHNVFLTVRHENAYPYSNLFLFLTTTYPDGKKTTDTLECILSNKKGEWLGDGAGDIWDHKIPLKQNLRFPQAGKYIFTFEQGMRSNPLPLIMDFGMTIEKVK